MYVKNKWKVSATHREMQNSPTVREIARELGLSQSTVCRHIAAAKRKLRHAAKYSPATASAFG